MGHPVSGTFIIDTASVVRFARVDLDFMIGMQIQKLYSQCGSKISSQKGNKLKIISLKIHGILDFVTVIAFLLLPGVFAMRGTPAYLCYILAAVHLLMTLLTKFPFGIVKIVSVSIHKVVEAIVGPALIAIPWILRFSGDLTARYVFIGAGIVIILVGILTNYTEEVSAGQK